VHGDATALGVATSGPGLQASWLIMWGEFGCRAPASLAAGSRELASAVMTDDNDDDANVGNLDDTLSEILGVSSRVTTSLDLDLTFGAVDVNVDLACTSLLSALSPLPPLIASPPPAAAREPI